MSAASTPTGGELSPVLLEVIACPRCHGGLDLVGIEQSEAELVCAACALAYPVRDGVPVLLADDARPTSTRPAAEPVAPDSSEVEHEPGS